MGVALHLRFPAGRYHATAWGHHVNEGVVDWPPAPFRLLRTLYARSFDCDPRPDDELLTRLLQKLSAPPSYRLPAYTTGHTRHYMPDGSGKPESRVQVLDAFIAVDPHSALVVQWPDVELLDDEAALLEAIASRVTYLGRAESWCDALVDMEMVDDAVGPGEGEGLPVPLLSPKRSSERLLDLLGTDTQQLRARGADLPADTHWLRYFVGPPASPSRRRRRVVRPTAVLMGIDTRVYPTVRDTVELGDALHRAVLSRAGDAASSTLTGRGAHGKPRSDGHRHAHFLPFDERGDGFLRHCLVYAEEGFSSDDLDAIAAVNTLRRPRRAALRTYVLESGTLEGFGAMSIVGDDDTRVWTSATPFLLPRHPKRRGGSTVDGPEDQLRRELEQRRATGELPAIVSLDRLDRLELRERAPLRWLEFKRWRGARKPSVPHGYGFRIEFEAPVRGPLALGFGSHFGLGLFRSVRSATR
ncbi:MAG: type I-U CRISPR-associated protein Csb2 [Sandaracinaceae bacterium]